MLKLWLIPALCVAIAAPVFAQDAPVLKVGDTAPQFSLPGTDGKTHALADYKGKSVVLAWYPAAFTGGCTKECKSFRDSGAAIKAFDIAYFMASVDTPEKNLEFAKQEQADFPMLSDPAKQTATAYGVLNAGGRANRWTFYIGPDGKIQKIDKAVNVDTAGQDLTKSLAELNVKKAK